MGSTLDRSAEVKAMAKPEYVELAEGALARIEAAAKFAVDEYRRAIKAGR